MVADAVIYHPTVAHLLKFQTTVVGRDKLLRTIQYFSRFYAWYLLRTNRSPASIATFDALKRQFGLVRRVLRAGKFLEHLKAASLAADASATSGDQFLRYAAVGKQLGYAGFLALDSLTLLDALGVRKWDGAAKAQRESHRLWVVGLLFSVVTQLYTQRRLRQREARIDRKDGEGVVEGKRITRERTASRMQLLSDVCDLTIPTSGLGWANFDDGFIGLAGLVSSLIGVQTQWGKTA